MNKKQRTLKRIETIKKYHTPSCAKYVKRAKNAIYINPHNSLKHELKKAEICYELKSMGKNFITEAARNTKDEKGKERRVDIVDLDTGDEIELECNPKRAERFKGEEGVIVVMVE